MRQPGSITMQEIQRLVGEQVITIESLRLLIEEQPKPLEQPPVEVVDAKPANGKKPVTP